MIAQEEKIYERLMQEGNTLMEINKYKEAIRKYFSASACQVSESAKQKSENKIGLATKLWTDKLEAERSRADRNRKNAEDREKEAEELKRKAEAAAVIIRSYYVAGLSNKALAEDLKKDAFDAAFLARDTIEKHNLFNVDNLVDIPADVLLSFNNAVFESKKMRENTNHGNIMDMVFSENSNVFATIGRDSSVRVWDTNLTALKVLKNTENYYLSAALSANGKWLLTTGKNSIARLWNIRGSEIFPLPHQAAVNQGVFFENDQKIITISRDSTAKIWNLKGALVNNNSTWKSAAPLLKISLSKDQKKALLHTYNTIYLWDLTNLEENPVALRNPEDQLIYDASFSPNGEYVLTTSKSNTRVWHTKSQKEIVKSIFKDPVFSGTIYSYTEEDNNTVVGTKAGFIHSLKKEDSFIREYVQPILETIRTNNGTGTTVAARSLDAILLKLPSSSTDTTIIIGNDKKINSMSYTNNMEVVNQEALLVTSNDNTARLWSVEGNLLMNMPMESEVMKASFFQDKIIAYTSNGYLYSIPYPELVYQENRKTTIIDFISPKLKKELKGIDEN